MTEHIQKHMIKQYPKHKKIFQKLGVLEKIKKRNIKLDEAIVRVIIGQMLSGKAAKTIYERVVELRDKRNFEVSWMLDTNELNQCGVSKAKSKSINLFGKTVKDNPNLINSWRKMETTNLHNEISKFWGMGEWTASIITLFYLGREDIFPVNDGSLNKALDLIKIEEKDIIYEIDPDKASPYRSYLALYLWKAIDTGLI